MCSVFHYGKFSRQLLHLDIWYYIIIIVICVYILLQITISTSIQ